MTDSPDNQTDSTTPSVGLESSTYEIIRSRLTGSGKELRSRLDKLNLARKEVFGSIDTALRLSPRDTFLDKFHVYYALAYFQAGQYQQAASAAEQAVQLKPEHANSHMLAASSYAHAGNQEAAEAALASFRSLVPGTNASNVERAIAYRDPLDRARIADGLRKAGLDD